MASLGAAVVLATSQEHRRAAFLTERLGALLPLHAVLYSAALGATKPDPAFYVAAAGALEREGVTGQVVLVDDLLDNVEGARRHGWHAVHFTGRSAWREEIAAALLAAADPGTAGSS